MNWRFGHGRLVAATLDGRGRSASNPYAEAEPDDPLRLALERAADLPPALPRAVLVRLHRSLERAARLEALQGPWIILRGEAELAVEILDWQGTGAVASPASGGEGGFAATFGWALYACLIRQPGAVGGVDLGLGDVPRSARTLAADPRAIEALDARWRETPERTHPWARHPLVPERAFALPRRGRLVPCDEEGTGPFGWVAGDAMVGFAQCIRELAEPDAALAARLAAVAAHVDDVHQRGHAVLAWLQPMPPEAEGRRIGLVAG